MTNALKQDLEQKMMNAKHFRTALRIYKWTAIIFLIAYIIYITYDDYGLFKKISSLSELGMGLLLELLYLTVYFLGFSFYYWVITLFVIFGSQAIQGLRKR